MPNILPMMMAAAGASSGTATLWSWGNNDQGQLGLGVWVEGVNYSSPQQVGSLADWSSSTDGTKICVGGPAGSIKEDGSLWTWGNNYTGQIGNGATAATSSPAQIGSLTDWGTIRCDNNNMGSIKTDGTLWMWGRNGDGQLGDGTTTNRSSPVQIGSLTTWTKLSIGAASSCAIKTDGTLWAWGQNTHGGLGNGNTTTESSPIQIGGLTTWAEVANGSYFSLAVKTDGTLWAWGEGANGKLGDGGYTTSQCSPVQVGSLTDWSKPASGAGYSSCIKTDGTFWVWGNGESGQLGLGSGTKGVVNDSPIQLGSLTNWRTSCIESSSTNASAAIKTDGTLWAWGSNNLGTLGQGNTTANSSPVQVGSLTTWLEATSGNRAMFGTISV